MPLVGIARLAAQSELLAAKSEVQYFEIPTRSILNRTKPNMPFQWTVNPYRGCELGCKYCYARFTHEFMDLGADEFETKIYAKAGAAFLLRQELGRIARTDRIAIGTATDPYQPAERSYFRTRSLLEVFARERGRYLSLTTKSNLILRDLPLLAEAARRNVLSVNITITTLDTGLARLLEPRAPLPELRLRTVRQLAEAGIAVGVFPNPVMPWITDSDRQLGALAKAAKAAGAQYFGGGPLFLPSGARRIFFQFLERQFPALAPRYRSLFACHTRLPQAYRAELQARERRVREDYGLTAAPADYRPELFEEAEQATLFPLQ